MRDVYFADPCFPWQGPKPSHRLAPLAKASTKKKTFCPPWHGVRCVWQLSQTRLIRRKKSVPSVRPEEVGRTTTAATSAAPNPLRSLLPWDVHEENIIYEGLWIAAMTVGSVSLHGGDKLVPALGTRYDSDTRSGWRRRRDNDCHFIFGNTTFRHQDTSVGKFASLGWGQTRHLRHMWSFWDGSATGFTNIQLG